MAIHAAHDPYSIIACGTSAPAAWPSTNAMLTDTVKMQDCHASASLRRQRNDVTEKDSRKHAIRPSHGE